jgi:hypothetical protein
MRKAKQDVTVTEALTTDTIRPIEIKRSEMAKNQSQVFTNGENGIVLKFRDKDGTNKIPPPTHVRVLKEGGESYRLLLYYLPGEAPSVTRSDGRAINTAMYDGNTFIIQTGTDEVSGKMRGKQYKNLVCSGWCYQNGLTADDDQRYEQVSCLTVHMGDWDSKPIDLKTLGLTREQLLRD